MRLRGPWIVCLSLFLIACTSPNDAALTAYARPAHFRVTGESVTNPVEPFTATVSAFGNSLIPYGGAFEPVVFRSKFTALEDSPDRVVIAPEALNANDTLQEGFLDDAEVRVYRIAQGVFRLVREDRVVPGGSRMSGWTPVLSNRKIVAADSPSYTLQWDKTSRPNTSYYFSVHAVDRDGRVSGTGTSIEIFWRGAISETAPENKLAESAAKISPIVSSSLAPPQNLRSTTTQDGLTRLEWDSIRSPALAGYAIYRSDYPPNRHAGFFLQLSKADASPSRSIRAGDMIMVSKKFHSASRTRLLSNRAWALPSEYRKVLPGLVDFFPDEQPGKSWELTRHPSGTPVEAPGETFLELRLAAGESANLSTVNHAGTRQFYYEVLDTVPYRIEVWLRQHGTGTVKFAAHGFYGKGPQEIQPVEFLPGPQWKKFSAIFTPKVHHTGDQPGRMTLEFSGPATFGVDNFRIYRADANYLDFTPEEIQAIRSSGMRTLRTHGTIKYGTHTYDMAQLTNARGVIDAVRKGNTLPQMLSAFHETGVQPWLQFEFHMAPEEWLGMVEYLAAPYRPEVDTPQAKPWAYKRYRQGHAAPWVDDFEKIYIELGNETWNRLFFPWVFEPMNDSTTRKSYSGGEVYGLYQEYVISILKSSPYWNAAGLEKKIEFIIGGWARTPQYSNDAARTSPTSRYLTIAAYNGGWDEGQGPRRLNPQSLFYVLNDVNQTAIPVAEQYMSMARRLSASRQEALLTGTYEAGPGYALNGLNNARVTAEQAREQEMVMKSVAAGTATLDAFLARALSGFRLQNFFTFDAGTYWKSHATWYQGGKAHPPWQLLELFNNQGGGEMLKVETLSAPSIDLPRFENRKAVPNAPLLAVYATRKDDRYNVVVISRKAAGYPTEGEHGYTPVTLKLPFEKAKSVTLFRLTGSAESSILRDGDIRLERRNISTTDQLGDFKLDAKTGLDPRGIPPGIALIYVFEGTSGRLRNEMPFHEHNKAP